MTTPTPALSVDVAGFLLGLLNAQQLAAGAPDFAEVAGLVVRAKAELTDVLENTAGTVPVAALDDTGDAEAA